MSPIEIKEDNLGIQKNVTKLEEGGAWTPLSLGGENVIIRLKTNPGMVGETGVIETDSKKLRVRRKDKEEILELPFATKPGDEITIRKENSQIGYVVKHLAPSLDGVQKASDSTRGNNPSNIVSGDGKKQKK